MGVARIQGSIAVTLLLVGTLVSTTSTAVDDKVVFLDVGQGDAILFQDDTSQILVDGGPGSSVLQRLSEEMPAYDHTIEVMVVSHPQQDHIEGLLHVMDRYEVELIVLPNAAASSQLFQSFLEKIQEKQIPYRFAWAGQQLTVGDMHVYVLAPTDTEQARTISRANVNDASTVLRVEFHDMAFLLTGDAERVAEYMLVQATDPALLDVDILKAGHHGSNTSNQFGLLEAASPSAVVISVGKNNQFNHPRPETLERFAGLPLWRTDEDGSVRFLWSKKSGWVAPS